MRHFFEINKVVSGYDPRSDLTGVSLEEDRYPKWQEES
jgi:hypothetical protein